MEPDWKKYCDTKEYHIVYCMLIQAARQRGAITYPDVAKVMGLPSTGTHMGKEVGKLIGSISANELRCGRPFLSALVVSKVSGKPGEGLYSYAAELGALGPGEDHALWLERVREDIYETWKERSD